MPFLSEEELEKRKSYQAIIFFNLSMLLFNLFYDINCFLTSSDVSEQPATPCGSRACWKQHSLKPHGPTGYPDTSRLCIGSFLSWTRPASHQKADDSNVASVKELPYLSQVAR